MKQFIRLPLFALVAAQIFSLLAPLNWFFELWSHYQHYYALLALILLCTYVTLSRKKEALTSTLIFLLSALPVLSTVHSESKQNKTEPGEGIHIISSNFYYLNNEFNTFNEFIQKEDPDLFIVHEASNAWKQESQIYLSEYPHQGFSNIMGARGIFIASKIPGEFTQGELASFPILQFETKDQVIIAIHPLPGINPNAGKMFRLFWGKLDKRLDTLDKPYAIIGDFNATPWSPTLSNFADQNQLHNFSTQATWHSSNALFQIPIDHALLSPGLKSSLVNKHYIKGSDHLAIETWIQD